MQYNTFYINSYNSVYITTNISSVFSLSSVPHLHKEQDKEYISERQRTSAFAHTSRLAIIA